MPIQAQGGPLHGKLIDASRFRDGEAVLRTITFPPRDFLLLPAEAVPSKAEYSERDAVYRLVDDVSGVALFVFWNDERPVNWSLVRAMENATDDEILKLMDDINEAG